MKPAGITSFANGSVLLNKTRVIRRFLILEEMPVEKTKIFLRALFESNIKDASKWFDIRDRSISSARLPDPEMTLEKYISQYKTSVYVRLVIGDLLSNEIRLFVQANDKKCAWFLCPLNEENFKIVNRLFKKAYGRALT